MNTASIDTFDFFSDTTVKLPAITRKLKAIQEKIIAIPDFLRNKQRPARAGPMFLLCASS